MKTFIFFFLILCITGNTYGQEKGWYITPSFAIGQSLTKAFLQKTDMQMDMNIGSDIGYFIHPSWGISSGLSYTNYRFNDAYSNVKFYYSFITLPLQVSYISKEFRRVKFWGKVGGRVGWLADSRYKNFAISGKYGVIVPQREIYKYYDKIGWGILLNTGVQVQLSSYISLILGLRYDRGINQLKNSYDDYFFKSLFFTPRHIGVELGMRFKLK